MSNVLITPTLADAFAQTNFTYPGDVEPGRFTRFSTNGKKHDAAGWVKMFDDGDGATFGCWRNKEITYTWQRQRDGQKTSAADLAALRQKAELARKQAQAEREADYAKTADSAAERWQAAALASTHPYLSNKGIQAHVARTNGDALLIPVYDSADIIQSLQTIAPDGSKRFMSGGRMAGGRCWIGEPGPSSPVIICEGYATGASIHEATGHPVVVAFNAGNLLPVAQSIRDANPEARIVIAGDDDKATPGNPGRAKATQAAKAVKGIPVFPEGPGSDFNDMATEQGAQAVTDFIRAALEPPPPRFNLMGRTADSLFKGPPPPQQWLVEGIFPAGKLAVLASPPGIGKSFLALDLAYKAAGYYNTEFPAVAFGGIVRGYGRTVYVSAEDDEPELHRRLYSLTQGLEMPGRLHVLSLPDVGHFGIIETNPHTKELQPTEAWQALAEEIRNLSDVRLIVLDTLQALSTGDTNDAAAVQPLMNQCTELATATGATVLLIHHVGKGSTKEIRTALDAAEAIRGSGAITGSARAAYVLWPPADGGRKICATLGEPFIEQAAVIGMVAKANGEARRDMTYFLRDKGGLLRDVTMKYLAMKGDDSESLQADLMRAIETAWDADASFAASQGANGAHARRFEMPAALHDRPRTWFDEQIGALLSEGKIKRVPYKGGHRLALHDAIEATEQEAA